MSTFPLRVVTKWRPLQHDPTWHHLVCWDTFVAASRHTCSTQVSHFVNSSHFLCKCVVLELLTVTLAGPSPALLNRLQGGGQAKLSAALGAHCLDKPGGLVAQLKLGQRGLASSLRWREIPCVLQRCRPQRETRGGRGRWRRRRRGEGWGPSYRDWESPL